MELVGLTELVGIASLTEALALLGGIGDDELEVDEHLLEWDVGVVLVRLPGWAIAK